MGGEVNYHDGYLVANEMSAATFSTAAASATWSRANASYLTQPWIGKGEAGALRASYRSTITHNGASCRRLLDSRSVADPINQVPLWIATG
jgi:hypothetical protein